MPALIFTWVPSHRYLDKNPEEYHNVSTYQACNTAFCLAGWSNFIALQDENLPLNKMANFGSLVGNETTAADWLGINMNNAKFLFYMRSSIARQIFDAETAPARCMAAIAVLEHLRDTGEVDWQAACEKAGIRYQLSLRLRRRILRAGGAACPPCFCPLRTAGGKHARI